MKHLTGDFRRAVTPLVSLARGQRGVTGLETAIILIAFVVVASVFAFTVLSTGIFSAERGKETVFAGLEQARGSIELKGSVIANGVADKTLDDADDVWTEVPANASATTDTTDKKQGTAAGSLTVAASKTGLLAYETISPTLDLSSHDSIQLWIKSSAAVSAGALDLRISDSTTCGTGGNYEDIDLPALAANTWKLATVGISASTTRTAVACVGLVAVTAYSSQATVKFDDVIARGQVTSLVLTIANAVGGEPIDLTTPTDSDDDGVADTEDRQHKLIVSYIDPNQNKSDLYWERSFVGLNDGDNLLEDGEKAQLTIYLKALDQATPLVKNTQFTLEVRPDISSALVVQRTTPAKIDTVMNLQ